MAEQHTTNAVSIFLKMVQAVRRGVTMKPRSANDKEYFAQDWFADHLNAAGVTFQQQGRNSYPDFLVTAPTPAEGYEVKSLAFTGASRPDGISTSTARFHQGGKTGTRCVFGLLPLHGFRK